jgi:hypothetical protein
VRRPAFWVLFALLSAGAAAAGVRYFSDAFSILAIDITMDRDRALGDAARIMERDGLGPPGFRQAASFSLDSEAQTFVELEGGGKDRFTQLLRDGSYAAYAWRVRHFKEGEVNETVIRFAPDGRPDGFVERLREDAPGAALESDAAKAIAERDAAARWGVNFSLYSLAERGSERRPAGRVDHTFTYERAAPALNEGRIRLKLVVSGDRLTEVIPFIKVPEAFSRRYESLRAANTAIGIGSVVGMALLYVIGGIGIGLFVMLRQRWVIWRPAAAWGAIIAALQCLTMVNEWPLMWMTYDTAVPRAAFFSQQIAMLVAVFAGSAFFYGLSFTAAETLTRRAFGSHPQFWRLWGKGPGSSTTVLGHTAAGYLLVSVFFAYDVLLYLFATHRLGWWSPSEALLHPDVLAAYVPWFSAIANSLQAGFWEECLFRAVPLAGAALIGDRIGKRRLCIAIAFVVQAVIFGAGHAPYPNQPAYARPVELIIPSFGFGLLYLYFGLLPGIILHFIFDTVWFALPIFVAQGPGVRVQQIMVVLVALAPVWIVLWRRMQAGRWTRLDAADRNAAWSPGAAPVKHSDARARPAHAMGARTPLILLALAAVSVAGLAFVWWRAAPTDRLAVTRGEAIDIARRTLASRGVTLTPAWRLLPTPTAGSADADQFLAETAGDARRLELRGRYVPDAGWRVRAVTFEGDVTERAEEWTVALNDARDARILRHELPEQRPGASLDEAAARSLARRALIDRYSLDADRNQVREVSVKPTKLPKRIDWTFAFADLTIPPLPQGEPRIEIAIAGDEVAGWSRFVFIPEAWQREQSGVRVRNTILQVGKGLLLGGALFGLAIVGGIRWSRKQFSVRLFLLSGALILVTGAASLANSWPLLMAGLSTAEPLRLQLGGLLALSFIAVVMMAAVTALALGALPARLAAAARMPDRQSVVLGVAVGAIAAAVRAMSSTFLRPAWTRVPEVGSAGSVVPWLDGILEPVTACLLGIAIMVSALAMVDALTCGWTRRRLVGAAIFLLIGFALVPAPVDSRVAGSFMAAAATGIALLVAYIWVFRFDLTTAAVTLGTLAALTSASHVADRTFAGATAGAIGGTIVAVWMTWWWWRLLRARSG